MSGFETSIRNTWFCTFLPMHELLIFQRFSSSLLSAEVKKTLIFAQFKLLFLCMVLLQYT